MIERVHGIIGVILLGVICCNAEFYVACSGSESTGFEKKLTWSNNCTQVCQSDCNSTMETLSNCTTRVSQTSCGSTSTCVTNQGCVCNDPIAFKSTQALTITRDIYCYNSSVTVRLDKCAMKHYGFGLGDIFFGQPSDMTYAEVSSSSPNTSCYGSTVYTDGPMYQLSFTFGNKDLCNIVTEQNSSHLTFSVGVHAYAGAIASGIDRTTTLFLQFDCHYPRTYTKSYGKVMPQCNETFVNGSCTGSTFYAGRIAVTNLVFDERLLDPSSTYYNYTSFAMRKIITQLFLAIGVPVKRVVIFGLSNGSVVADYVVEVAPALGGAGNAQTAIQDITQYINNYTFTSQIPGVDSNFLNQYKFGAVIVKTADATVTQQIQNPCYSGTATCDSRAICTPLSLGSYTCQCALGYVDVQPSQPGRVCRSTCSLTAGPFCLNNGICIINPTNGLPSCLCQGRYEGNNCENIKQTTREEVVAILPWIAVGILLLFVIVIMVMYTRRRRYFRKTFADHSFLPDAGPSNSDAVVGLMHHGPGGHHSFLE